MKISKDMKCSTVIVERPIFVPGLTTSESTLDNKKYPGMEMYLLPNGMVYCQCPSKKGDMIHRFTVGIGNVKNVVLDKESKIELSDK